MRDAEEVAVDGELMAIRLPIASTGQVRNEGDQPLTHRELRGMARQVDDLTTGVFAGHGSGDIITNGQYSQFEKLGYWADAEIEDDATADGEDLLYATARMPDPDTLPATVGDYKKALSIIKEQATRGIPIDASIGWREDGGYPGDVDLMEASIVGIGADPRTNTEASVDPVAAVTRAAVSAGADPDDLVAQVRATVDDARPLGPPGDPDRFDSFEECTAALSDDPDLSDSDAAEICGAWEQAKDDRERATYDVDGEEVEISPPEAVVNAAEAALEAKSEYDDLSDCGTGVGERRARQIIEDAVGPDVIDEMAAYLTSHEEDVNGLTDPPTDWSESEWTEGCGPVQYALWGGTATGTGIDWAQARANEVAEARGEEIPYPNRAGRNLDDPAFAEGDAVVWTWDDEPVHGRVAGIHEQFTPPEADSPITGEDGEAVYSIHEYDREVEAFRNANVAKPESSLNESGMDMPPASEDNFVSEQSTTTTDEQTDATRAPEDVGADDLFEFVAAHFSNVEASDVADAMPEDAEFAGADLSAFGWFIGNVVDMPEDQVVEMLEDLIDSAPESDEEQGDDMDDDEDDEDEEERDIGAEVADLRESLNDLRSQVADGAAPSDVTDSETREADGDGTDDTDAETTRDADGGDDGDTDDGPTDGPDWRA